MVAIVAGYSSGRSYKINVSSSLQGFGDRRRAVNKRTGLAPWIAKSDKEDVDKVSRTNCPFLTDSN